MPFPGEGVWLVNWVLGGALGGHPILHTKQGMLFSIVPRFGNTWFLLCLEQLDADWFSGCVSGRLAF